MNYNPRIGIDPGVYPEAEPASESLETGYDQEAIADGGIERPEYALEPEDGELTGAPLVPDIDG